MSEILQIVASILIVGVPIAIGVWATVHFSNRKSMSFCFNKRKMFDAGEGFLSEKLSIFYGKESIKNIFIWDLAIWNGGNQPIRQSDIVETDRLRFTFPNHRILDFQDIRRSREVVRPAFEPLTADTVFVSFALMDAGDYVTARVVTEQTGDELGGADALNSAGTIVGIPRGPKVVSYPIRGWPDLTFFVALFFGLLGVSYFLFYRFYENYEDHNSILRKDSLSDFLQKMEPVVSIIVGAIMTAFFLFLFVSISRAIIFVLKRFTIAPKDVRHFLHNDQVEVISLPKSKSHASTNNAGSP